MPLITENIEEAKTAYVSLEGRAFSAEAARDQYKASLDDLRARLPVLGPLGDALRQQAIDQAAVNAQLVSQNVVAVSPDMTLSEFIAEIGLAAALGEATLPGRTIPSVGCQVRTFVTVADAAGEPGRFGLRFHQPELGDGAGLSQTTFEIVRTPMVSGAPAPPSLYAVLEDAQRLYADAAWAGLAPAAQLVVAAGALLADPQAWSFAGLATAAGVIGALVQTLAPLAPPAATAPLKASADALVALAGVLAAKTRPVAGDLTALTAALDGVNTAARAAVRP